jgi:hypothetical protein
MLGILLPSTSWMKPPAGERFEHRRSSRVSAAELAPASLTDSDDGRLLVSASAGAEKTSQYLTMKFT